MLIKSGKLFLGHPVYMINSVIKIRIIRFHCLEKEEILKERQLLEETEQAFLEYAKYQKSAPLPKLRSAMAAEEPDNGMMSDESSAEDEEEDVNLQEKLEEIDIEREGYGKHWLKDGA